MKNLETLERVRGLFKIAHDAIDHGSAEIERLHLATAHRPFDILEQIPAVNVPAREIRTIFDVSVTNAYALVRLVNGAVARTAEAVLDAVERAEADASSAEEKADSPTL